MTESKSMNKLRWRCRRGTMELDLMLLRYLERCYPAAERMEQQSFVELLEREDTDLMRYLIGDTLVYPAELANIIHKIRSLTV